MANLVGSVHVGEVGPVSCVDNIVKKRSAEEGGDLRRLHLL